MHFKRSKASVRAFNVGIFSFHKVSHVHGISTGNDAGTFQRITEGIDGFADLKAGSLDKEAVIAAMKEAEIDGVTGHITFDENGDPIKSVAITTFENGEAKLDTKITA